MAQLKSRLSKSYTVSSIQDMEDSESNFIDDVLQEQEKENEKQNEKQEQEKDKVKETKDLTKIPEDTEEADDKDEYVPRTYTINFNTKKKLKRSAKRARVSMQHYVNYILTQYFEEKDKLNLTESMISERDLDWMEEYARKIIGYKELSHFLIKKANVERLEHYSSLYATNLSVYINYIFDSYLDTFPE